jgi:hypothetical protein
LVKLRISRSGQSSEVEANLALPPLSTVQLQSHLQECHRGLEFFQLNSLHHGQLAPLRPRHRLLNLVHLRLPHFHLSSSLIGQQNSLSGTERLPIKQVVSFLNSQKLHAYPLRQQEKSRLTDYVKDQVAANMVDRLLVQILSSRSLRLSAMLTS